MADEKNDPLAALRAAGLKRQQEAEAAKAAEAEARRAALAGLTGGAVKPPAGDADERARALDALRSNAPAGEVKEDASARALDTLRSAGTQSGAAGQEDAAESALNALRGAAAPPADTEDDVRSALDALRNAAPQAVATEPEADTADALRGLVAQQAASEQQVVAPAKGDAGDDLAALLGDAAPVAAGGVAERDAPGADDLDDLLSGLNAPEDAAEAEPPEPSDDLAALLGDLDGNLDAVVPGAEPASEPEPEMVPGADDLDALLSEPAATEQTPSPEPAEDADDLAALLGGLDAEPEPAAKATPDPLDDLLADAAVDAAPVAAQAPQIPFGLLTAPRPSPDALQRPVFRMAIMGDFSGRAARGVAEIGPALASRRAIKLDVDTVEDVIEGFATTLILPVGKDGAGIEVRLRGIDDLHPDELFDKVDLFEALRTLRQRLGTASTSAAAVREMVGWAGLHDVAAQSPRRRSSGSAIPADRPLSALQDLIGGDRPSAHASGAEDLIAQVVGPHIVAEKDPQADALRGIVDQSLSEAMRLILHHPEFQSVESLWRTLDLLARRIETDSKLRVILYDISAEEFAADLAAQEDLAASGLFRLLADEPLSEAGDGGFSAVLGLYTFEETPPHAELLARMGKIAAHIDAPFFAALSADVIETAKDDRHKLTVTAWDALRALPEAGYLGLATPRFLLRRPYGARSEPIDAFDFDEFTMQEGLQGMLWANPVVAVAVLLAAARTAGGAQMELGKIMSLGEMPFHFVTDRHGDQVALPCTERNLTTLKMEQVISRGLMPLVSPRGRDEVRLASFQSLAGAEILGPWSSAPRPAAPAPGRAPDLEMPFGSAGPAGAAALAAETAAGALDDLDDLLAGFADDATPTNPDEIDADLAALLEGL